MLQAGWRRFSNVERKVPVERLDLVLPSRRKLLHFAAKLRKLVIREAGVCDVGERLHDIHLALGAHEAGKPYCPS